MFTFACASVEGLTLAQKRATVKALQESIKRDVMLNRIAKRNAAEEKAVAKAAKEQAKVEKAAAAEAKLAAKIAKAQERLQKMLDKASAPVGAKAIKANRKPGKVTTYGAEDNAIAAAIMAKKATA